MGDTHLAIIRQIEQLAAQDFHTKVVDISILFGVSERTEINMVYSPEANCEHLRIDLKELISGVVYIGDLRIEYVIVFYFLAFLNHVDVCNYGALSASKSDNSVALRAAD